MKTNIATGISTPIPYLAKFWVSSYGPKWCQATKLQHFLNVSNMKQMMNFIISMQINIEVF